MTVEISFLISIVSICCVVITLFHNLNKDKKGEINAEESAIDNIKESLLKANIKLDCCNSTLTSLMSDIKTLNTNVIEIDKRTTILERDLATAFKRIDDIQEKISDGK